MNVDLCSAAANFGTTLGAASGGAITLDFDRSVIAQAVLFFLFVLLLKPLLFDPVLRVFEARERRTEGAKEEARELQVEAGALLQRYDRELERVQAIATEERDKLRADTARLESEILEQARAATARIVDDGRRQIDAEVAKMKAEIQAKSAGLATAAASRVLGRPA